LGFGNAGLLSADSRIVTNRNRAIRAALEAQEINDERWRGGKTGRGRSSELKGMQEARSEGKSKQLRSMIRKKQDRKEIKTN
jgi:hypothetical protein